MSSTSEDLEAIAEKMEAVDWTEVRGLTATEAAIFASRLQRAARRTRGDRRVK